LEAPPASDTGAEEPPSAPAPVLDPNERARHIEDALVELGLAERALEVTLNAPRPAPGSPPVKPAPTKPVKPGTPGTGPTPSAESGCETACMALASMRRSASYVCRLAGAQDNRCTTANVRVKAAEERVRTACAGCGVELSDLRLQRARCASLTTRR
jgi:hypothetical protein